MSLKSTVTNKNIIFSLNFLLKKRKKKKKGKSLRNTFLQQSVLLIFNKCVQLFYARRKKAWPLITVAFFCAWFNRVFFFIGADIPPG